MNTSITNNVIIIPDLESETLYHAEVIPERITHVHAHRNAHTGFYPKLARAFKFPSEEP